MKKILVAVLLSLSVGLPGAFSQATSVTISGSGGVYVGDTRQYTVTFQNAAGQTVASPTFNTDGYSWHVTNSSGVPVSGLITSEGEISCTVKWTSAGSFTLRYSADTYDGNMSGTFSVTVSASPGGGEGTAESVALSGPSSGTVGETAHFYAIYYDSDGDEVDIPVLDTDGYGWSVGGNTIISSTESSCEVLWTKSGTITVHYSSESADGDFSASKSVVVVHDSQIAEAATDITDVSFVSNWDTDDDFAAAYLQVATNDDFSLLLYGYENLLVTGTSQIVSGLSPGTYYYYRLSVTTTGSSFVSNAVTVQTNFSPPVAIQPANITTSSFTAQWNEVDGGTQFSLQVATDLSFLNLVYSGLVSGTSKEVGDLSPAQTYYYRLTVLNELGQSSNYSNVISCVTLPIAPLATDASGITPLSFVANWNGVTSSGYQLDVSTNAAFTEILPRYDNVSVSAISLLIGSLDPEVTYYYRVRAVNASGAASVNSNVITVTTPVLPNNYNWIKEHTLLVPDITTDEGVASASVTEKTTQWTYYDGIGRVSQQITVKGSPNQKDLVQPIEYDGYGREAKKYLPYASANDQGYYQENALTDQAVFYTDAENVAHDIAPYAKSIFESSPLNRMLKQGAPGNIWQPMGDDDGMEDHTQKMRYESNGPEEVILFQYNSNTGDINAVDNGVMSYYAEHTLYANKTFDEHNNEVVEYVDKDGLVILKKVQYANEVNSAGESIKKYAQTYYIYDDWGNLVVVLPPEGVREILTALLN